MTTIALFDAKNKLSELLDRVATGETIAVTRHGKKIALLTPVHQPRPAARQGVARLRQLRTGARLRGLKIRQLRDEGRP
jgi:prevent-host-death family protein